MSQAAAAVTETAKSTSVKGEPPLELNSDSLSIEFVDYAPSFVARFDQTVDAESGELPTGYEHLNYRVQILKVNPSSTNENVTYAYNTTLDSLGTAGNISDFDLAGRKIEMAAEVLLPYSSSSVDKLLVPRLGVTFG